MLLGLICGLCEVSRRRNLKNLTQAKIKISEKERKTYALLKIKISGKERKTYALLKIKISEKERKAYALFRIFHRALAPVLRKDFLHNI